MSGGRGGGVTAGGGGAGYNGMAGYDGAADRYGNRGAGGGGAAGGGAGGSGRNRLLDGSGPPDAPGGAGGTAAQPDGGAGVSGAYTGGGGGGGANGSGNGVNGSVGGDGGAGGAGGPGRNGYGGGGGAGGYGLVIRTDLANAATIAGGAGGQAGAGGTDRFTQAYGGDGGIGVDAAVANVTVSNGAGATIRGGAGGAKPQLGGYAGRGGAGVTGKGDFTIRNDGAISGGAGGRAGPDAAAYIVGYGGAGVSTVRSAIAISGGGTITGGSGSGVYAGSGILAQASATVTLTGNRVSGGAGSASANGDSEGGFGANILGASTLTIDGGASVTGGAGGAGGPAGYGGDGGGGVYAFGGRVTLGNGRITGGRGGTGTGGYAYGGAGMFAAGATLVTNGTISGGLAGGAAQGAQPARADALRTTSESTLALGTDAAFEGSIRVVQGNLTFDQGAGSGLLADATVATSIVGEGSVTKRGAGTLTFSNANTYSGSTVIQDGALDLAAAGSGGTGAISFRATGNGTTRLVLEMAAQNIGGTFANTLESFDAGDGLDLRGFPFNRATATITPVNNRFTVSDASGRTQTFQLSGSSTPTYFAQDDGAGGTLIVCYCAGTAIRTPGGDMPVEALAVGDLVVTASGAHRPIRWLGRRSYGGRFANRNPGVLPVCLKAGALAQGVPARDLWVSPKHAMFLDGVLVPAACLVNGTTVIKAARVDRVDYHHVELDSHDVLLAEGAPSESFVDDGGRHIFHNARDYAVLYPGVTSGDAIYCAPRIEDGHALAAIRRRIDARAGLPCSHDATTTHLVEAMRSGTSSRG